MTRVVDEHGRPTTVIDRIDKSRRNNSPSQVFKVDGGAIAIAFSLLAFGGVLVAAILLPQVNAAQIRAEVAEQTSPIAAQVLSAQDRAWLAERNSTLNAEQMKELRIALARKGLIPKLDGHGE